MGRRRRPRAHRRPVPGQGRHQRLLDPRPRRGARRPAAHRPRGAAAAPPAGARLGRPGGRPAGAGGLRPGVEGLRHRRGDPPGLRGRHPGPAPAARSGSWWRDGVRPCGPSSLLLTARQACEDGAGTVVHWAEPPPTMRPTRPWPSGRSGSWPADPLSSGRRARSTARAELVTGAAPTRSTRSRSSTAASPRRQWVRDADLLLRERARPRQPDGRRPASLHLSVSSLVTLRRDPAELAAGCAGRCPAHRRRRPVAAPPSTPGWSSGSARRSWSTSTSCPARADEFAAPGRRSRRAAGGVPRERVGRPPAGRGRGALRDAARAR